LAVNEVLLDQRNLNGLSVNSPNKGERKLAHSGTFGEARAYWNTQQLRKVNSIGETHHKRKKAKNVTVVQKIQPPAI
jgi:hypothetical protein